MQKLGFSIRETNKKFAIRDLVNFWKADTLPDIPVNMDYSAFYLHENKALTGSVGIAAGNLINAKLECILGLNPGITGSLLANVGPDKHH